MTLLDSGFVLLSERARRGAAIMEHLPQIVVKGGEVHSMSIPLPPAETLSDYSGHNFVLIHGLGMAPMFWRLYAPRHVLEHKAIAYPLPGHDQWPLPTPGQLLQTKNVVQAYAAAIERDFHGQPVTLVGHSTGGFVSLAVADAHPDLVRSVVLLGGFACGRFEGRERMAARLLRIPGLGPALFQALFKRWISTRDMFRMGSIDCVYDKSCPWETVDAMQMMEEVRARLQGCRPEDVGAVVHWLQHSNLLNRIGEITIPVLNLIGTNDAIVPPDHQLRLSRQLPNVMTVLFGNTGHLLMIERQSDLNKILARFSADPWIVLPKSKVPTRRLEHAPGAKPAMTSLNGWIEGIRTSRSALFGTKTSQAH